MDYVKEFEEMPLEISLENPVIDLTSIADSEFKPLPPGIYNARLIDGTFTYSKSKNQPMITWNFEIQDEAYLGRRIFYHTLLTSQFLPRLKRLLIRIGPDLDLSEFNVMETPKSLVGRACRLKLKINKQGTHNEVADVLEALSVESYF